MQKYLIPPDTKHRTYRGRYRVGDNPKVHEITLRTTVKEVAEKLLKEAHEDAQRESVGLIPAAFRQSAGQSRSSSRNTWSQCAKMAGQMITCAS
jgi:hypothetical protein